jgi:hypothetical protein
MKEAKALTAKRLQSVGLNLNYSLSIDLPYFGLEGGGNKRLENTAL